MCHIYIYIFFFFCWKEIWGLWEEGLDYTAETLGGRGQEEAELAISKSW